MNQLSTERRAAVIRALVDGCSIRATVRMTGAGKNTIARLLADMGPACAEFEDRTLRGLTCERIQLDEVWCFCYAKEKNVPAELKGQFGYGDVWTWTALDADTKLIVAWHVGRRTGEDAHDFMLELAGRIVNVAQVTSDGFGAYPEAVSNAFGQYVNFAQLIKIYRAERPEHARYSPAECVGCRKEYVIGAPDPEHVSTSLVERQNLTMRMSMRRFTRLTNGHSKKVENHVHAVALHSAYYNFCRKHMSLGGKTPAMAAGVADHVWTVEELVGLLG